MNMQTSRRRFIATSAVAALLAGAGASRADNALKFDLAPYEKIPAVKFPWGWIRWLMNAEIDPQSELTIGIVYVEPKQSNPLHIHPNSAEVLHVLAGACDHQTGKRWDKLQAGDSIRIPQNVPHHACTHESPCLSLIVYNTGRRQMVPVTADKT
jgi:quercetin dioxygenase-like cupin family protein